MSATRRDRAMWEASDDSGPTTDAERRVRISILEADAIEYERRGDWESAIEARADAAALELDDATRNQRPERSA